MLRFGTAGIRGAVTEDLTPGLAVAVGHAAAPDGDRWVVGRDGRTSGPALGAALAAGLSAGGGTVIDIGQVPTPVLAFASRDRRGIQVTASHNPPIDNGFKFFNDGREYDQEAERRLERRLDEVPAPVPWADWSRPTPSSTPLGAYRRAVTAFIRSMDGLGGRIGRTVAVDYGTGTGGLVGPQILTDLGVTTLAVNAHVDGHFSARDSKPTPSSLEAVSAFIRADDAIDIGFAHDGDADRIAVLDGAGEPVHPDTVIAVLAGWYLERTTATDPVVVTTPNASTRIDQHVRAVGGRTIRGGLGQLHETIAAIERDPANDATVVFAAEPWKHIHPAFGDWMDGLVSAALLTAIVETAGSISELRSPITEPPTGRRDWSCPEEAKPAVMQELDERLPATFPEAAVDRTHGIRLEWHDGAWLLIRPSGTEPYIRGYGEGAGVDERLETATALVREARARHGSDGDEA